MVNRFGRAVGAISSFDPKGALPDGLPAVQRGAGADSEALFQVGSELAGVFGHQADRAARIEGRAAGEVAGNDPAWRPTGSTTIRGQAFDEAAMSTYVDRLDASISRRTREAFQAWSEDPNRTVPGLTAQFDKIRDDVLANDAFDQVKGRVQAQFEKLRTPFEIQARKDAFDRVQDGRRRAGFERINEGQTTISRVAALDPSSPATESAVAGELKSQIAVVEQMARNGDISEEVAGRQIAGLKTAAATQLGTARVNKYTDVAKLDEAKKAFERDFAAGKLPQYDAKSFKAVNDQFDARRSELTTAARTVGSAVQRQSEDMLDRASKGAPPPPAEVQQFHAGTAVLPDGERRSAELDRRLSWVRSVDVQGPEAAEGFARKLREEAGSTPTKEQAEDIQFLHDLIKKRREETATDPLGLASRLGLAKVPLLNIDDPTALASGLRERIALADSLPAAINPNRLALEPETRKAIARKIEMGGAGAAATIQALVRGAGKDAPRVMRELGGVMPEAAHAGVLLAQGGSPEAARDILNGLALREMAKSGGGAKLATVKADALNTAFTRVAGALLDRSEEERSRLKKSAETIVQSRAANGQEVTPEIMEQAVRDVLGENRVNGKVYGGVGKTVGFYDSWRDWRARYNTIVPPEVEQGRFGEVLAAIRDDDLRTLPNPPAAGVTAAQLRAATPVLMSGGYRFALGDPNGNEPKFLRNAAGGFFTLPWEGVRGVLQGRVPGAFKGATP